jgi:hypothetical protein
MAYGPTGIGVEPVAQEHRSMALTQRVWLTTSVTLKLAFHRYRIFKAITPNCRLVIKTYVTQ